MAKFRSRIPLTLLRPALPAKRGLRLGRGRVGEGAEGGHQPSGNVDLTRPRRQTGAPGNEVRPIGIALVGETTASHAMISGKGLQRLNDRSCRRRACIVVLVIGPGSLSPATATAATSIGRRALVVGGSHRAFGRRVDRPSSCLAAASAARRTDRSATVRRRSARRWMCSLRPHRRCSGAQS